MTTWHVTTWRNMTHDMTSQCFQQHLLVTHDNMTCDDLMTRHDMTTQCFQQHLLVTHDNMTCDDLMTHDTWHDYTMLSTTPPSNTWQHDTWRHDDTTHDMTTQCFQQHLLVTHDNMTCDDMMTHDTWHDYTTCLPSHLRDADLSYSGFRWSQKQHVLGIKKVKEHIAVNGFPSHSYRTSLAIWNHTVLPATRHKWMRPALTLASKLVLDLPTTEGWKAELT